MRTLFLYIALFIPYLCISQSTNVSTVLHSNVKKADQYFDHFAYRNALHLYLHAHDKNPGNYHIRERIAECYFRLHDPVNAEKWFSGLINEPDIHAEIKFEYAEALSMNGKYAESLFWFEQYLEERPGDVMASEKAAFLRKVHWYREDSLRFVVVPAPFNTDHSDYGAHYFHEGVVFASSRDTDVFVKHKPFDAVDEDESLLNLFYAGRAANGEWTEPVHFHNEHIKTFFHEGPMAFYDNDRKGAFTRTILKKGRPVRDANGRSHLGIYLADVNLLGSLENIVPFEHNNAAYSVAHPTFNSDGTVMYFSSTSPAGFGDSDIYYSILEDGKWSEPINLGAVINTREDESFPFLANDSTLYFSSNGHGTLGGLDIVVSYRRNGVWTKARNFGEPLNTQFDDFSLISDSTGRVGFIASNRPGGKGLDDIYFFIANYFFVTGETRELGKWTIVPEATVNVFNEKGELIESVTSDGDGSFALYLPYDQNFTIRGEKEGYETIDAVQFSTIGRPFGTDSLLLPLWKHNLFAKGKIYSNETEDVIPGATVIFHNLTDNKSDTLALNEGSEYRLVVIPNREYRVEAIKDGYIPNGFNLSTKGLFDGDLINDIILEEVYIDKEIILFDYDKSEILPEAKKQLDKIVRTLRKEPKSTLNIGAHADSRGSHPYNQALSERRAEATVKYIVSKGISRSRIEAKGFGEEFLVNRCSDGVECPEEDHTKNRRAELKVQE
jgi:outer membrane protein OmpA-like peptidoglycan-associated protein